DGAADASACDRARRRCGRLPAAARRLLPSRLREQTRLAAPLNRVIIEAGRVVRLYRPGTLINRETGGRSPHTVRAAVVRHDPLDRDATFGEPLSRQSKQESRLRRAVVRLRCTVDGVMSSRAAR